MKTRIVLVCLAAGACIAFGFALTRTNHAAPDEKTVKTAAETANADEESAIRKAAAAYAAAFAKGDADAVIATWTADAEFIDDDGKVYRGRETLAPMFTKSLPSYKGYKI